MTGVYFVRFNLNSRICFRRLEARISAVAVLALVYLKLCEIELIMLEYESSSSTGNFKAISTGSICGAGYEYACCTVRVFALAGNVVLNLNVVPFSEMTMCVNL